MADETAEGRPVEASPISADEALERLLQEVLKFLDGIDGARLFENPIWDVLRTAGWTNYGIASLFPASDRPGIRELLANPLTAGTVPLCLELNLKPAGAPMLGTQEAWASFLNCAWSSPLFSALKRHSPFRFCMLTQLERDDVDGAISFDHGELADKIATEIDWRGPEQSRAGRFSRTLVVWPPQAYLGLKDTQFFRLV